MTSVHGEFGFKRAFSLNLYDAHVTWTKCFLLFDTFNYHHLLLHPSLFVLNSTDDFWWNCWVDSCKANLLLICF